MSNEYCFSVNISLIVKDSWSFDMQITWTLGRYSEDKDSLRELYQLSYRAPVTSNFNPIPENLVQINGAEKTRMIFFCFKWIMWIVIGWISLHTELCVPI